ncbi:MAG TPA: Ig-like domain-containing protein [Gemmatimonadota bacterium]|nr:Ig-like domain-containing protein [Gemmatimonadota bacterium]
MRAGLAVIITLLVTGCNGVGPFEGGGSADGLAVIPQEIVLGAIGARRQLVLTDSGGSSVDPGAATWRSSNPLVAAVDGSGMVIAVGDGQTTITAEFGDEEATTVVTVAATIELTLEVTATDQSDADASDNSVVTTITVREP